METKWTDEQLLAIETRGKNLLVAAAAGSGKTAVLVERIIKIITDDNNPVDIDKLLVVTFTNAAASEMRERIGDAISKKLEEMPDSKMLQRQLALLNKSNITTIHSFCLDIIKNNFHLIDLDPGFRIGDETECTLIKQDVLIELFEDKYDKEDEGFLNLIEAYCTNRDDERLKEIVLKLYNFSMSGPWPSVWLREKAQEFNINSLDELEKASWYKVLKESLYLDLNNAKNGLDEAIKICEEDSDLAPYLLNLKPELNGIENAINSLNLNLEQIYKAIKDIEFAYRIKTVKKGLGDELDKKKVKSLRDDVKKKINQIKGGVFSVSLDETLNGIKNMYPIIKSLTELVIEFSDRYVKKKMERVILDFNDLEHLCLKILTCNDENGEVYASSVAQKFREKFEEVLVDEYQDSNNVQETIISMVSRKDLDNPNVFMVGDVKQSIYRFRQAKPELFLEKYNSYSEEDNKKNRKIMLYKNFRSREEVIKGVNFIFKSLMSKTVGELDYTDKEALNLGASYDEINKDNVYFQDNEFIDLDKIEVSGALELHILDKSSDFEDGKNEINDEDDKENDNEEDLSAVAIEARIIAKRIKELINPSDGKCFMVFDKNLNRYRKITYKDIVILLRSTKNWADTIVEELSFGGIPVYADINTGYFQTIEIRTIMSLLHIIDNPMQDIYTIASMRSPIFAFTSEELADIRILNRDNYFYLNVKDIAEDVYDERINKSLKDKCVYFIEKIGSWREKSLYMPIDEFLWYLYSDTSYYGYVGAMVNGIQRQANLRILFQRAKQYEQTSFKGLFNFINFINKLRKSSGDLGTAKILGENEDVVRIMSIHKSKGLEFPVVFLSGCGKQFNLRDINDSLLFHEELGIGADCIDIKKRIRYTTLQKYAIKKKFELETLSEEMRILYVALTRAKEKLIITGSSSNLQKDIDACYKAGVKGFNKVIPSELLKQKSYLKWIMTALIKHKDGDILRQGKNEFVEISDDLSSWKINFHKKSDFGVENVEDSIEKKNISILSLNYSNFEVDEEIRKRLEFRYKYRDVCSVPSNISVSDIKKAEEIFEPQAENLFSEEKNRKKPKFIMEEKGLSKAEKGTAMHFVMQKLDLNKVNLLNEIKEQIKNMFEKGLITKDEEESINIFKIQKFFKSNLGQRLLKAYKENKQVFRELPFITEIPVKRIEKDLIDKIFNNEKLRLQGIIDCFFEEDDGIVLLDYKTDYVENGKEKEILDKYKVQIDLYTETLERVIGKKVKERYLYLFGIDKEVKYMD
ncbi:MAG: helicase-exonuclease AddAB subunit AddA [Sarcina ventriculi]|uniref:ATP-dependent helicase/nuclease subunit A n=1 Tax=Sarcina ventriculi TaxID=1267 RepID=A0ABP2AVR8_SARVE|nr:helicase-exonuclease AddAB subunit AddA [Sarcina ventriculi]MDO4401579.1 helicase-exonuclease AddAB subunit AddA [Clostridiaceae bacterium]MBU5323333.1 helicase-exonuclease AddAB subunit AddA [Sarcina ventriculi]MCI5635891.1 helicase-exonuclease AddAB subunit AddA [Sarcina ventriculi]MDY7061518.1 helicase-exonuclease AddAB subunit AddA [Sarcina ventriculi]CUO18429.1 ATP-dependent helicase/nuclease subunit A [Sarcina ventriculi]